MKSLARVLLVILGLTMAFGLIAQPAIQWQRCFGGASDENEGIIHETTDGGYIMAGNSYSNDGDVSGGHGLRDVWVVKLSSLGNIEWQRCLGGSDEDLLLSIEEAADSGYILTVWTQSNDGDVTGYHGGGDAWIVKLSSAGALQWQKCLGGSSYEQSKPLEQTNDGGYILAMWTLSNDGDVLGFHQNSQGLQDQLDIWLVKLSSMGAIEWQRCLGGTGPDYANSILQTLDGGYILAGSTASGDGDVTCYTGSQDIWVVKLSVAGAIEWQRCLGGSLSDWATIKNTVDGGYVVAGHTLSNDGDVMGYHGGQDIWVMKLSAMGTIDWQKCLGGTGAEYPYTYHQTLDGGFIIAGHTDSNDGDVSGYHGDEDAWVVKLSSTGQILWQKCLGGTGYDGLEAFQTPDGGYIASGQTNSNDGDVTDNHGGTDIWVVKLSTTGVIQWQKCFGGLENESGGIIQSTDGSYIAMGYTDSNDGDVSGNHGGKDLWVVRLGSDVGITDNAQAMFTLSPNPANHLVALKLPNAHKGIIEMVNTQGALVLRGQTVGEITELNISEMISGLYMITVRTLQGHSSQRFLVE
ncbi:MAG: T9SS type A sorting domain-containing protein [Flavobacteriales bacterium]|nr:T9SS type A sorting domain-containing protein [Flavobacteriales bacterium]